jgi:nicotinamidase-related amidase
VFVLEDCCAALTDEQHQGVIDQMNRMTTILTSKEVTFTEGVPSGR